jgi:hypothetical protein
MRKKAEHGGCSDDGIECSCPVCRGDLLDPAFVGMIEQAAVEPVMLMTAEEAMAWFRAV